jgi:phage replication-related protein YjqB (UPF0714/DUF867 family)
VLKNRNSGTTILAPHGGKIESHTSKIAEIIAGQEFNLYCFEGCKKTLNYETLHITSHKFDEPRCITLLSHSRNVFTVHGCDGTKNEIYIGGRNKILRRSITKKLQDVGLTVYECDHKFLGEEERNICNRGITGAGIQFELTKHFRSNSKMKNKFIETIRNILLSEQSE